MTQIIILKIPDPEYGLLQTPGSAGWGWVSFGKSFCVHGYGVYHLTLPKQINYYHNVTSTT